MRRPNLTKTFAFLLSAPMDSVNLLNVLPSCVFGGIAANVCYFAGPIVETYAAWLGWRNHRQLRPVLFGLGTLFTMLMATGVLANLLIPGLN